MLGTLLALAVSGVAHAGEPLAVGSPAPPFTIKTETNEDFVLESRKGWWTVLYFYPKDGTPGCTKQACAFRDGIELIRKQGAEVYGVSQDGVERHRKFVEEHKLNFGLLADVKGEVAKAYGADGVLGFSKRWTYIMGPDLTVRWVKKNVDPALNAKEVATELEKLVSAD